MIPTSAFPWKDLFSYSYPNAPFLNLFELLLTLTFFNTSACFRSSASTLDFLLELLSTLLGSTLLDGPKTPKPASSEPEEVGVDPKLLLLQHEEGFEVGESGGRSWSAEDGWVAL